MKVGLVGVGYIGYHHLRNLVRLDREGYIDFLCASDIDESKRNVVERFGVKFYNDYLRMIESENIDILSIATPTKFHVKMAKESIRRGIHVLIEKPVAESLKEAYELKKFAERYNAKIMVGHIERFNPAVIRLKKFFETGEGGHIISLSSRRLGGPRLIDTGVIFDLAIHDLDVMLFLTGRNVTKVYATAIKTLPEVKNEDYAVISLTFEDNILGRLEVSRITPVKIRELDVNSSKCYIRLDYLNQEIRIIESFLKREPASWSSFQEFLKKFSPTDRYLSIDKEEPLYIELKSFISSVAKNIPPPVTIDEAIDVMRIAFAAVDSYRKDKMIVI